MSKKSKQLSADVAPETPPTLQAPSAADLIARAKQSSKSMLPPLTPEGKSELQALLEYNDASARQHRVPAAEAVTLLQGHGWTGSSTTGLNSLCSRLFGRRTYGTK